MPLRKGLGLLGRAELLPRVENNTGLSATTNFASRDVPVDQLAPGNVWLKDV